MITQVANNLLNATPATSAPANALFAVAPMRVALFTDACLDDDVRANLLGEGFAVRIVRQALLREPAPADIHADIVAVDRSLPGLSSIEAMAQLRFHGTNVPVVFVNGLASLMKQANYRSDVVGGGLADSVASALRLAATMAHSENATPPAPAQVRCGKLLLQPDTSRASWDGEDIQLTFGEYKIIDLLASQPGQYFTYRAIYDRLRHEGFIAGEGPRGHWANVRSAIKRIRGKFRALDPSCDEIENYVGVGYCWRKPV
jgi:two-component system, OmpR family, response regulator ChvI